MEPNFGGQYLGKYSDSLEFEWDRVFQPDPCECRPLSTAIRRDCEVRVRNDCGFVPIFASESPPLESLFIENHERPVTNPTVLSHNDCFFTSQSPHFLSQSTPSAADCYFSSNLLRSLAQHKQTLRHPEIVILLCTFSSSPTPLHQMFDKFDSQMKLTVLKRQRGGSHKFCL